MLRILLDYFRLTKPRLTLMALLTTFTGFYMASDTRDLAGGILMWAMLGAFLVGGGANTLNQFFERVRDAKMIRTQERPLPGKRVSEKGAFVFGTTLALAGVLILFLKVNALSGWIGALTLFSYLLVYTPLKTRTPLNTPVGAVSGAAPALIGWAAARGSLEPGAWALFGFIFVWQLPHFLAIAWVYRQDYLRGGFCMVAAQDPTGSRTAKGILVLTALLILASFAPLLAGIAGLTYLFMAIFCGIFVLGFSGYIVSTKSSDIRKFIPLSIVYLFILNLSMILDKA